MKSKSYRTFRTYELLALSASALAFACIMLCCQTVQAQTVPVVDNISPNGNYQFQPSNTLSFTVNSSVGIAPSAITVQLTGTTLSGQTLNVNLTTANGLIVAGTSTSRSVSAPLTSNMVYQAVIQATDANENTTSSTVSFDTISPAYTFEAEDFDYNSGHFIDNPQTNKYSGLNVTYGVDAQNGNFNGGASAYRPSGLNTEVNGDIPRLAYSTGLQDYDVGWNDGGSGNWGNYTRTFPAGAYNIYMRASNPNGFTADGASMSVVTSGRGTSSQTTSNLGTFSVPSTGNWQTYAWVPLLDANGNLAKFTGGSVETLRVTTDNGSYNANFYLLMPADTNQPTINNLYPDGSNFFQYTNVLSFSASCSAGISTNSIVVNLDGVNVAGLTFSGSPTNWNVSCPLLVNTNHTVVITVTANNGNVASETINFNDFQSTDYQWEAEDYDYTSNGISGLFFDNPQTNAYFNLPSAPNVDNHQFDLNANPFDYRTNSIGPCPSTTPADDAQRPQFATGKTDYNIGFFGGGSWLNYTRHYPAGTYNVWGRFAEGGTATETTLSQLTSGYGTSSQTVKPVGVFFVPPSGGWNTWEWTPLENSQGNLVKVRFDGSQYTLQLDGSPVGGQPEVNVNFLMLAPAAPVTLSVERVVNIGATNVQIVYSDPVEAASATNIANYAFTIGLAVTGATLAPDGLTVTLTTAPMVYGADYSIVINGVRDNLNLPNTIATNTIVTFQALPYASQDIGNPAVISIDAGADNGINVTAGGSDFGGTNDQGNFSYQIYTGNFDVCVRVANLGLSDIFAKAGLMARETLDTGSRFAASIATPTMNGCFFEWRDPAGSAANTAGDFPANYPDTWLRLQRVGNTFTGYAGYDGQTWTELGSDTISMSNQVYLGFAVSSDSTNQVTTAQFRDISNVTNAMVSAQINPHESLGPSSRKTPIVFSEIMYKPAPRTDGKNLEFVELYNSNPWFQDISGYQITCADMSYKFPPNTTIAGGGFLVVAAAPPDIESVYGITNVMGPYSGSLKKSESLELLDEQTNVLLTVPYSNVYPWPAAADGTGHSIVLANPTYGEGDPRAWDISDIVGGSPGQMESFRPSPLRNVVINEILAHSENSAVPQFVELYNHSTNSVDISGCILTDDPTTNKFVVPPGAVIGPASFISFTQSQLGFTLNGAGDTLYFIKPDGSRILDAVQFGGQADGVSYGRWPDGANDFYNFTTNTPGTNNSSILIGDIVINELMYDPISGNDDDQYVELYNQGTNTVNLNGWQFTSGITFTFPNISIAPNGYLVVARNMTNLFAKYPNLNSGNTVGDYSGKLSHNGELVELDQPETLYGTNTIYVEEDEVTYGTGGRWGEWSSGGGSSLELIDPRANHRLASNWADSDETSKSVWTNIETTGVLDNGANYDSSIDYAQIGILDVGECLVDNVEVDYNGVNYVSNPDFESGTNGWSFQGCMTRSSWEDSGYESSHSLHIRSSDHIWPGDNSCQVSLNNTSLQAGQTVTIRFKARWLHGWPEALLRLNGNWLEAAGALPVPSNLGSPGMANSRAVTNAGPAIYNVTHTPSLPAANQPVVVTANVQDPDGLQNLTLYYRLDPSTSYTAVPMNDGGTNGDAIPRDGIFSATIPGQAANQIVAFYISATDSLGTATRFPALRPQDNEPVRECVVMFGDGNPGGSFGVYHLWITQTNATRWSKLGDMSNEGNDCTIVCGKRVIYNAQARFAGSPYHQNFDSPYGSLCHYKWIFPDDDRFLGATSFNKIHQPGNGPGDDPSLQREQLANTFLRALGVPWLNRRYVVVYVNGNRRGYAMEDTQCPDSDMVKEYFPNDSDGYLYKMQPWFEFAPFLSGYSMNFDNQSWCTLNNYTTTGGRKKVARYRYNYLVRRTPDSASDFTSVFSLVDAANSYGTPNYVENMENIANMENWMRVFAANHAAGNWDSFGAQNGQNLYGYIGTQGTKYSLMMFDFNIIFGNQDFSWGPGENLLTVDGSDPFLADIYNTPVFLRMYWRALQELVNGPLNVANSGPLLDAKYNVFTENGFSVENPDTNIEPWLSQAQASIAAQLAAADTKNFTVISTVVSNDVVYVNGTAPVDAQTIWINGVPYSVTWTSVINWTVIVPLKPGLNQLNVVGVDIHGQPIAGETATASVTYNGTTSSPVGQIVINEIMYNPPVDGAQFVELYNNSPNETFDLSGWQLQGLSYTFPSGSILGPTNFLILAANRAAFAAAYGATNPVFDTFSGALQPGQILSLVQPEGNGTNLTVTEVQYDDSLPWPNDTNEAVASLQLIDPHQDNWRVGNWAMVITNAPVTPQWVYVTATGTASSSTLYIYLQSAGDVYIDDLKLVAGSVPEAGANVLSDSDFESGFPGPWTVSANLAGSTLSTSVKHSGNASLHVISTSGGTTQSSAIWQTVSPALSGGATYTLSFWYLQSTNGGPLTIRLSGSGIVATVNPAPPTTAVSPFTPDAVNSVATALTPFPSLWINELQADNVTGITNSAGQHSPWLELYNPGTNVISLDGLYLANHYTNLTQWAFPTNASIAAGEFKVIFADGLTDLSTTNELHTSFSLSSGSGSLALCRLFNGQPQVLDYVNYNGVAVNDSYGSLPDGQSFNRQEFFNPTPGEPNNSIATGPSFIPYTVAGSVYTQDFDSLPDPGATSVNTANPVTINGITYSLANPFNFASPVSSSGSTGGLGVSSMAGWYGLGIAGSKFGATDGDQTTGGQISFGLPNSSNRALGLLATSSTSGTAFGAKLVNYTTNTFNYINLQFTGEVWRQSNLPKTLEFYYFVDPTATAAFSTSVTTFLPKLNVNFPTVSADVGGAAVNGTSPLNQINLSATNQVIANWPPGAALWLVWEMADSTGKAQGLAIDNLSFSASVLPSGFSPPSLALQQPSGTNFMLTFPTVVGPTYQLEYNDDLGTTNWIPLESITGTGNPAAFNVGISNTQRFFRLVILP
jgi:regulation of enolase protein 1 (concanavalin A-like superfamily)